MTNENKIIYMKDEEENKLLPYQFYNEFDLVSLPMSGKQVLIPNWQKKTKTVHPSYINQNIGLLTGKVNGITVLDVDVKDDGMKLFSKLIKEHPDIKTPTVKSPGGSIHLYFNYNKKIPNSNRILVDGERIGWDIKNDGSIITSPPSIYPGTDKRYKWVKGKSLNDLDIIAMPNWLEKYILDHLKPYTINRIKKNKSRK
jgi:hypothetical protein